MKTEEEISEMRDRAAQAAIDSKTMDNMAFTEGVRDALAWVLGDMEEGLDL